jgi:hypothetical protein
MKFIFTIIFLTPFFLKAQFENIKLENGQVFFEKIYQVDSIDINSIEKLLTTHIPRIKDLTDFNKTNEIIIAKIKNSYIDYKKYGGKWVNTPVFLNHPFFADVSIVWKENKYRATVTNMYFNVSGLGITKLSEIATKKKETELDNSKGSKLILHYIDSYLSDLFKINRLDDKDNW